MRIQRLNSRKDWFFSWWLRQPVFVLCLWFSGNLLAQTSTDSGYHFFFDGIDPATGWIHHFDNVASVKAITSTGDYYLSFDIKVADNDQHERIELNLITGTNASGQGYRDRLFIEDDRIRVIGPNANVNYNNTIYPQFSRWDSMQTSNRFELHRQGSVVSIHVNGQLIYQGSGGESTISSTQLYLGTSGSNKSDVYLQSMVVANDIKSTTVFGGYNARYAALFDPSDNYQDPGIQFRFSGTVPSNTHPDKWPNPHHFISPTHFGKFEQVRDQLADFNYVIEFELNVADLSYHELVELNITTGTNGSGVGYRDRLFIEDNRLRVVNLTPSENYSNEIYPQSSNWMSMANTSGRNKYRYERSGDNVTISVNGDVVYRGSGGSSGITSTQVRLSPNGSNKVNIYLYSLNVFSDSQVVALFGDSVLPGWSARDTKSEKSAQLSNNKLHIDADGSDQCLYKFNGQNLLKDVVADGIYAWEFELATGSVHERIGINLITGHVANQTDGYRDRLFIENDQIRLLGMLPNTGYSNTLSPTQATSNWTSMADKNTYRIERHKDDLTLLINGDVVYRGTAGTTTISSAQLFLTCKNTYLSDIFLSKVALFDNHPSKGHDWIQTHDFVVAGTTDSTDLGDPATSSNDNYARQYKQDWHGSAADVFRDFTPGVNGQSGQSQIMDYWEPLQVPWVEWITPGSEIEDANGNRDNWTKIDPTQTSYQIGYHIGGEPHDFELQELLTTAQALKDLSQQALVYGGLQTDLNDLFMHNYMDDSSIDLVMGHRYNYNYDTYRDLARYRKFGLQYGKPYWRFLCSFTTLNPQEPPDPNSTSCSRVDIDESDFRFEAFSSLLYGYKGLIWFFYNIAGQHNVKPVLFTEGETYADNKRTEKYHWVASINQQIKILGRELAPLRSDAVYLTVRPGQSQAKATLAWSQGSNNDPYLTAIEHHGGVDTDIVTGLFVNDTLGDRYFMIQSGLHQHAKDGGVGSSTIRLSFDFSGDSVGIEKLNKSGGEGIWESVELSASNEVDVVLNSGDADLFRYVIVE